MYKVAAIYGTSQQSIFFTLKLLLQPYDRNNLQLAEPFFSPEASYNLRTLILRRLLLPWNCNLSVESRLRSCGLGLDVPIVWLIPPCSCGWTIGVAGGKLLMLAFCFSSSTMSSVMFWVRILESSLKSAMQADMALRARTSLFMASTCNKICIKQIWFPCTWTTRVRMCNGNWISDWEADEISREKEAFDMPELQANPFCSWRCRPSSLYSASAFAGCVAEGNVQLAHMHN